MVGLAMVFERQRNGIGFLFAGHEVVAVAALQFLAASGRIEDAALSEMQFVIEADVVDVRRRNELGMRVPERGNRRDVRKRVATAAETPPLIRPLATFSPQAGRRATCHGLRLVAPLPACGERVARSAG